MAVGDIIIINIKIMIKIIVPSLIIQKLLNYSYDYQYLKLDNDLVSTFNINKFAKYFFDHPVIFNMNMNVNKRIDMLFSLL